MKLSNSIIYNSVSAVNKLATFDLPIKVAYQVKKNLEVLKPQVDFIEKQRQDIINKYGNDGAIDQNDTIAVSNFVKDFTEVLEIEEELNLSTIDITNLDDIKMSASDLEALSFMLSFDE